MAGLSGQPSPDARPSPRRPDLAPRRVATRGSAFWGSPFPRSTGARPRVVPSQPRPPSAPPTRALAPALPLDPGRAASWGPPAGPECASAQRRRPPPRPHPPFELCRGWPGLHPRCEHPRVQVGGALSVPILTCHRRLPGNGSKLPLTRTGPSASWLVAETVRSWRGPRRVRAPPTWAPLDRPCMGDPRLWPPSRLGLCTC